MILTSVLGGDLAMDRSVDGPPSRSNVALRRREKSRSTGNRTPVVQVLVYSVQWLSCPWFMSMVDTMSLNCDHQRACCSSPRFYMSMDSQGGMDDTDRGNRRTRRKTCPSATLSTTNPTWTDLGLCVDRPATNRLSHGTAPELSK
jgi:hypothetical protein